MLRKLKLSDEGCFKELFEKYYSRLCRHAYYVIGNKHGAEDIVQNFFAHIWKKRDNLKIEGEIDSYLFVSVRNASCNYLKRERNKKMRETEYSDYNKTDNASIDKETFLKKLQEALNQLPEQCREIYCLKNMEGLSYKEIADYLQISVKTVDVQIYRALKKLRESMGNYKNAFYQNEQ